MGIAWFARKGERRQLGIVDDSGVGKGVEQNQPGEAEGVFRSRLHFDLFVLLDLGLQNLLLLMEGPKIVFGRTAGVHLSGGAVGGHTLYRWSDGIIRVG